MSAGDYDGEENTMSTVDRVGGLCVCLFLVAALLMLAVELRDITIWMP